MPSHHTVLCLKREKSPLCPGHTVGGVGWFFLQKLSWSFNTDTLPPHTPHHPNGEQSFGKTVPMFSLLLALSRHRKTTTVSTFLWHFWPERIFQSTAGCWQFLCWEMVPGGRWSLFFYFTTVRPLQRCGRVILNNGSLGKSEVGFFSGCILMRFLFSFFANRPFCNTLCRRGSVVLPPQGSTSKCPNSLLCGNFHVMRCSTHSHSIGLARSHSIGTPRVVRDCGVHQATDTQLTPPNCPAL